MSVCGALGSSCGASSFKCCSPLFCSYNSGITFGTIVDVEMFMDNEILTLILLISTIFFSTPTHFTILNKFGITRFKNSRIMV